MSYVDGFVLVVPKKKIAAYRRIATAAGKVWREYGALDFKECVLDDPKVMKDKRLQCDPADMPFDPRRMSYGEFKVLVQG